MCTLVLIHRVLETAPLVVLANRDEMLDRPSLGPRLVRRDPAVFCGQDQREGGTWCGVNEHGLFVGLTNLTLRAPDPSRRSRGLLCVDVLARRSFDEATQAVQALDRDAYNPFNLVVADGARAVRVRYDGGPTVEELAPGVHATTNWPVGSEGDAKRIWAEQRVGEVASPDATLSSVVAALQGIAGTHERDGDPRASICCHVPGYGTRSSSVIALGGRERLVYLRADGPPCQARFDDHSAAVRAAFGEGARLAN